MSKPVPEFLFDDEMAIDWCAVPGHVTSRDARRAAVSMCLTESGYDGDDFLLCVNLARHHYKFVWMYRVPDDECPGWCDEFWQHCGQDAAGAMPWTSFDVSMVDP